MSCQKSVLAGLTIDNMMISQHFGSPRNIINFRQFSLMEFIIDGINSTTLDPSGFVQRLPSRSSAWYWEGTRIRVLLSAMVTEVCGLQ